MLDEKLRFKPASSESESHKRLTGSVVRCFTRMHLSDRSQVDQNKATPRAQLVVIAADPETQRNRLIKEVRGCLCCHRANVCRPSSARRPPPSTAPAAAAWQTRRRH